MVPLIQPHAYFDPAVFELERQRIFASSWQVVGFMSDLSEPNRYITADLNGHSIVVQNFGGSIRAFRNSCSHRFCRIHNEDKGEGPLRCPYHGWTYDQNGEPTGIPSRPRFDGLTRERIRELALAPYRTAVRGELVFGSESAGPAFEDFLGSAAATVTAIGSALGPQIDVQQMQVKANWKILIENGLEGYHVPFVHRNTIHKLGIHFHSETSQGAQTWWRGSYSVEDLKSFEQVAHLFNRRPYSEPGYLHQFLFPNLALVTSFGTVFSVQTFVPISPECTNFTTRLFQTRLEGTQPADAAALQWLNGSAIDFSRQVFSEDARICERVQLGVHDAQPSGGILSDEELRVQAFHRTYLERMQQ